jgi:hypothetical protein
VRLSTLQFARSSLFPQGTPTEGGTLASTELKVRFKKRSHDLETHRSYEPNTERTLPANVAMRQVEAGNAEYVVEASPEEPPQAQAQAQAAPEQSQETQQQGKKSRRTQTTPPGAEEQTQNQ